jgi:hypothetical protein
LAPGKGDETVLVFPEEALGMRQAEPYEIGARDSETLDILGFPDTRRKEIYRFIFYRGQGRTYDAVEAASQALVEIERLKRGQSDRELVESVRTIEMAALRTVVVGQKEENVREHS